MNRIVGLLCCGLALVVWSSGEAGDAPESGPTDSSTAFPIRETGSKAYRSIVERNVFGLKPSTPAPSSASPRVESSGNLFLTGVVGLSSRRQAFFTVAEPGKASSGFIVGEGEENEWLHVLSVDMKNSTVKARLKKSLMRLGTAGAEVVLSFETDGLTTAKRQLGPHAPSPGASQFLDGTL